MNNGCHWCGKGCTTFKSSCVPSCGNSILDEGEECDDGNEADGDGCSSDCRLEKGFTCNTEAIPTACVVKEKAEDKGIEGGAVAGIVIGVLALIALIVIGVILAMLVQKRKKEEEQAARMVTLGENNGLGLGAEEEEEADVFDPEDGQEVENPEEFPLMFGDSAWTFGLRDGKRGEIGKVLTQRVTIANCGKKKVTWKIYPKRCEKYRMIARPQEGVISKVTHLPIEQTLLCITCFFLSFFLILSFSGRASGRRSRAYAELHNKCGRDDPSVCVAWEAARRARRDGVHVHQCASRREAEHTAGPRRSEACAAADRRRELWDCVPRVLQRAGGGSQGAEEPVVGREDPGAVQGDQDHGRTAVAVHC